MKRFIALMIIAVVSFTVIAEAPALHAGLTLGFPALSDIDGAITIAPVLRPYNMQTKAWDFSGAILTSLKH